jgi:hypothetical protein
VDHFITERDKQQAADFIEDMLLDASLPIPVKPGKDWNPEPEVYGEVSFAPD